MYESFYGLQRPPFDLTPDPKLLVLTETHSEALSNLEYGISRQKGIILLTGVPGSGKTTVIRAALERQSRLVKSVYLSNPAVTRDEFMELLAARFRLSDQAGRSKARMLHELEALVRRRRSRGIATVLLVDEGQSVSLELLEEIRLLANIEKSDTKLLTIVLAGQPQLADRLDDPRLAQLKQRIELRCELRPLTPSETAGYLVIRIERAGGTAAKLFTHEAVEAIHTFANGVPRMISVLADNALIGAFGKGLERVTRAIVLETARELHIGPAASTGHVMTVDVAQPSTGNGANAGNSPFAPIDDCGPDPSTPTIDDLDTLEATVSEVRAFTASTPTNGNGAELRPLNADLGGPVNGVRPDIRVLPSLEDSSQAEVPASPLSNEVGHEETAKDEILSFESLPPQNGNGTSSLAEASLPVAEANDEATEQPDAAEHAAEWRATILQSRHTKPGTLSIFGRGAGIWAE